MQPFGTWAGGVKLPSADRKTATLRRHACLLRPDLRSTGRATWGPAHRRGLSAVVWPTPAPPLVVQADRRAVAEHTARLKRRDQALPAQVQTWRLAPVVDALQARRGGQCPGAVPPVAALGALTRCEPPRPLMHDLGFTPAADSTGEPRRQGGSTTPGTSQARRALGEGAWASRDPATGSQQLQLRLEKGSKPIQAIRWKAQIQRGQRSRPLRARGQQATQVGVAMAQELRACLWAMAQEVSLRPSRAPRERPAAVCTRCCSALGSGAAPVWCHPRRRSAADTTPRASREAGP
jgi:transposase